MAVRAFHFGSRSPHELHLSFPTHRPRTSITRVDVIYMLVSASPAPDEHASTSPLSLCFRPGGLADGQWIVFLPARGHESCKHAATLRSIAGGRVAGGAATVTLKEVGLHNACISSKADPFADDMFVFSPGVHIDAGLSDGGNPAWYQILAHFVGHPAFAGVVGVLGLLAGLGWLRTCAAPETQTQVASTAAVILVFLPENVIIAFRSCIGLKASNQHPDSGADDASSSSDNAATVVRGVPAPSSSNNAVTVVRDVPLM